MGGGVSEGVCDSASSVSEGNEGKQHGVDRRSTHQNQEHGLRTSRVFYSTSIAKHRIRLREAWGFTFGTNEGNAKEAT